MPALTASLTAPNGRNIELPLGLFINNEFTHSTSGLKIVAIDPSDESDIVSVDAANSADIDNAVKAARAALTSPDWADISATERSMMMFRLADLVDAYKEALATLESWNSGKPYQNTLTEDIPDIIWTLRYYAGWADKTFGQTIPTTPQKLAYTIRQPIGVCGQIIPWNYPLSMAAWKLGPALACGNTVVLKPSEDTPLSILLLATLIAQAGFPPGVVNIVNGYGREAGSALVAHPDVDKIAFTGSTATGRLIMQSASKTLKNITLETGGKSPMLVFNDADLQQAAMWAHVGIMSNAGQMCCATSRILVHEDAYESFFSKFKEVCLTNKVGSPWESSTFQGPQVTKAQYDTILRYIETGKAEATLALGGNALKSVNGKGFYVEPTVFTRVSPDAKIFQEEVFGPFVTITTFQTEEEGVALANNSVYGLAAAVFTQNVVRSHRVARLLDAGTVWVNSSNDVDIRVPFGGFKQSGIGRELGEAGLAAYSQTKSIHINLGTQL